MEAVAGASVMAAELFDYNKENYLYDRRMRQRQELKIMSYRNRQALLWRQDVRDLVELTIGKMDAYTVVNALQLSMSIEIITAGRIAPGTPQWLMWQYLLSLAGAFAYLFMAVWLAMHASVSAHAGRTRLLTQFVRLPIPSWEQLEASRTYANSVEGQGTQSLLRVPFLMNPTASKSPPDAGSRAGQGGGGSGESGVQEPTDPWGLERAGLDIYELQQTPVGSLRHVDLVRRAAVDWQAYDAFTRVSMTLGTTHLLYALHYWLVANILVQNGEMWGPCFICVMFSSAANMLFNLDVSLRTREAQIMKCLFSGGPVCGLLAAIGWCTYCHSGEMVAWAMLPLSFGSHSWLLHFVLQVSDVKEQPNGTMLPTRWRAVLYLDVFGWLFGASPAEDKAGGNLRAAIRHGSRAVKRGLQKISSQIGAPSGGYMPVNQQDEPDSPPAKPGKPVPLKHGQIESMSTVCSGRVHKAKETEMQDRGGASSSACAAAAVAAAASAAVAAGSPRLPTALELEMELWRDFAQWQAPAAQAVLSEEDRERLTRLEIEFSELLSQQQRTVKPSQLPEPFGELKLAPPKWLLMKGHCDIGTEIHYLHNLQTGEVKYGRESEDTLGRADVLPLSLPATEQRVAAYHDAVAHDPCSEGTSTVGTGSSRAISPKGRRLGLGAALLAAGGQPGDISQKGRRARPIHPAARAAAFPDQWTDASPPPRPEDACWGREPGWSAQHHVAESVSGDVSIGVAGVGATGAVPTSSHHTFKPDSYYPHHGTGWEEHDIDAVVTGHDQLQGRAPWFVFSSITRLLSVLWLMGVLWCLGRLLHAPDVQAKPLAVVQESIFAENDFDDGPSILQTMITNTVKSIFGLPSEDDLVRELVGGEEVVVKWPHTSKFEPRKLSCDATGQQFAVADDFGVWFARLEASAELVNPAAPAASAGGSRATSAAVSGDGRGAGGQGAGSKAISAVSGAAEAVEAAAWQALRSTHIDVLGQDGKPEHPQQQGQQQQQQSQQPPATAPHQQFSVSLHANFGRLPLCSNLEGQKPQDVSVICTRNSAGGEDDAASTCSAVVLHGEDQARLTACPLRRGSGHGEQTWTISQDWLDDIAGEEVRLLAVDASCTADTGSNASSVFMPSLGTCTVVSTSRGRVVQLRNHMRRSGELVPAWATVPSAPAAGSIGLVNDHLVLALVPPSKEAAGSISSRYERNGPAFMLRALSKETGSTVGEWALPRNSGGKPRQWTGVATGGGSLFLLEAEDDGSRIWRFPLPERILHVAASDRRASSREPAFDAGAPVAGGAAASGVGGGGGGSSDFSRSDAGDAENLI